ncbi:MAG: hypothetical protein A2033_11395 [Bacteroidetes bacterium GWA2_31_9]|nr:MAG: hypothetical protein A2033_11395 [Bacteroidetes bacterium GWA2_31_9]
MIKSLVIILLIIFSFNCYSQENSTFTICNKDHIFSIDNYLLKNIISDKIKEPKKSPEYINNGLSGIKSLFEKKSIESSEADNTVFRSHIAFIVNCNGEIGNFQIISKNENNIKLLEEKLLLLVKENLSTWTPAENKKEKVDCYQVLVFTVLNGNITNVFYK